MYQQLEEGEKVKVAGDVAAENEVVYKLRDFNKSMTDAWSEVFSSYQNVNISCGDIFKDAPHADAIVSPANSFGFMDGGIDMVYTNHFGWQMQERLQSVIHEDHDGELLVGDAIIIPAYADNSPPKDEDIQGCNEEKPIKFLISAPTMRVPLDVRDTVNAYLAFRAVIRAVNRHNKKNPENPIRSVLCPGLGTAVGRMSHPQCAKQMLLAYETYELRLPKHRQRTHPEDLYRMMDDHENMILHEKKK